MVFIRGIFYQWKDDKELGCIKTDDGPEKIRDE